MPNGFKWSNTKEGKRSNRIVTLRIDRKDTNRLSGGLWYALPIKYIFSQEKNNTILISLIKFKKIELNIFWFKKELYTVI